MTGAIGGGCLTNEQERFVISNMPLGEYMNSSTYTKLVNAGRHGFLKVSLHLPKEHQELLIARFWRERMLRMTPAEVLEVARGPASDYVAVTMARVQHVRDTERDSRRAIEALIDP